MVHVKHQCLVNTVLYLTTFSLFMLFLAPGDIITYTTCKRNTVPIVNLCVPYIINLYFIQIVQKKRFEAKTLFH